MTAKKEPTGFRAMTSIFRARVSAAENSVRVSSSFVCHHSVVIFRRDIGGYAYDQEQDGASSS